MSQTVITQAFEELKAQEAANGGVLTLDEFVFASVPDLNITDPIDRTEGLPPAAQIVHRQAVSKTGMVNSNAVVYSVVLGADVGDFEFNWVGLLNKASGVVAMIVHAPSQKKIRTQSGQQGNVLTRSFLMEYNGASTETQITTPADTWQIDFTARLNGVDERIRKENKDTYGAASFLQDGFLVSGANGNYLVKKGAAYIEGLRAELLFDQSVVVASRPAKIWVDVCWRGTLTSVWATATKITVADTLVNYVAGDEQHYVFAIAEILADGSVIDLRKSTPLVQLMGLTPEPNVIPFFDAQSELKKSPISDFSRQLLAGFDATGVLSDLGIKMGSYADIRAYSGPLSSIHCFGRAKMRDGGEGMFVRDETDTVTADNGGTVLLDAAGRRWKRVFSGDVLMPWFCVGDGLSDLTAILTTAITYCATNGHALNWYKGKYKFSNIDIAIPYGYFNWKASGKVELICTSNVVGSVGQAIKLGGIASPTLHNFTTRDITLGEKTVTLDGVSDISIGDLLVIRNNHCLRGDNRGSWQEGQITQVTALSGSNVTLDQDTYYYYRSGGNTTVTVTGTTSGQSFSAAGFSVTNPPRDALYKLLGLTGENAGVTKMITAYDDATKTFTVGSDVGTGFPNTPAVGDTFRLVRQAEAWAVYPATFNIDGDFHLKTLQGLITNATAGQNAWDGIIFDYCVNGLARFAFVENFPNTGITLRGCLRCTVKDTSLYGINRVHGGDGGTGNAVSIANSGYCTVKNINVGCSRRAVDIGGSNWSSIYNNVNNITMRGGGVGYAGGIIFPSEGWTEFSYGWGSHGGAAESKYRGNVAVDCFYGVTLRGFNEMNSGCEIRGLCNLPIRLYYGSGITITDTHYIDGFTETTGTSNKWWKATNSGNRKLRPSAFILITPTYTLETPTIIKGCSAKSTMREFVVVDTDVVAPGKIDGVLISGCTVYVDNSDSQPLNLDAYMLRINGGPSVGDNFGLGGGNQMILVGTNNTVNSGKLFHASGTCEGAIRKSEGVWEMWVEANTSQSLPLSKGVMACCVDVINDGGPAFYAGLNMLLQPNSAVDGSPFAEMNKTNLVINAKDIATPKKMGISIVNGRLYFNNGTSTDIRATVRVGAV